VSKEETYMNFEATYGVIDPRKQAKWYESELGGKFLIAPLGNLRQVEENMKLTKFNNQVEGDKTLHDVKTQSCDIISKSVLLGWDDITDPDGKAIPYTTHEGAKALYYYDDFRAWVIKCATELSDELGDKKEELIKN
jgi:hypothetical protein